jgi:phosphoglycolate phosphatase-like HAD superfamily hydrolase
MIGCIVFDFDGTLVVSNHIKRQAFYEVTHSYDPSGSTVTHILKHYPDKDRHGLFLEIVRELFAKNQSHKDQSPEALATQWVEAYTFSCEQAIATCQEVSGTSETLRWISQQNIPIFVNSRTPTATLRHLIRAHSFNPYVTEAYGAPASKSDNLRLIQERTKKPSNEILMVGDSEDDRKAASEFGCPFVGVNLGIEDRFTHQPELKISDLHELKQILTTTHSIDIHQCLK